MPQQLDIQIIRSDRSSLSIEITPQVTVLVKAPKLLPDSSIQSFINKKWFWINTHVLIAKKRLAIAKKDDIQQTLTTFELQKLSKEAAIKIKERVQYYSKIIGVTYKDIKIRSQISRWGSCSSQGNLNFNCLLMLAPPESLNYVVIHELCHRKEMNHSKRFWALVEKAMPDYEIHRKWLKINGFNLIAKLGKQ